MAKEKEFSEDVLWPRAFICCYGIKWRHHGTPKWSKDVTSLILNRFGLRPRIYLSKLDFSFFCFFQRYNSTKWNDAKFIFHVLPRKVSPEWNLFAFFWLTDYRRVGRYAFDPKVKLFLEQWQITLPSKLADQTRQYVINDRKI